MNRGYGQRTTMMIKIAICDDDKIVASNIENLLLKISKDSELDIDIFYDGDTLVQYVNNKNNYDLIYLDIEMARKDGIEAAKNIRKIDDNVLIVYVTGYESFAKEAFEVSAFRFITKPIDERIFEKYFLDAKKKILKEPGYFQFQYNKVIYRILVDNIMYFQSDKRVTYIVTNVGSQKCYGKLNDIEKSLLKSNIIFYRVHQSFLVNPQYVKSYAYDHMELADGTVLTISENRRRKISEQFCSIKGDEIIVE